MRNLKRIFMNWQALSVGFVAGLAFLVSCGGGGGAVQTVAAAATSLWTQLGTAIYYNSGNVGIGTTTPATQLHIAASGSQLAKIQLGSDAAGRNFQIVGNPGGPALHFIMDNGVIGTNDIMVMRSSGNVGLGTTGPTSQLQLTGYLQLATIGNTLPPAADCNQTTEYGRMKVDEVNGLLYICGTGGWVSK